jgi:dipeptidyl aminopeptidase/acylaminoacyl peptidase
VGRDVLAPRRKGRGMAAAPRRYFVTKPATAAGSRPRWASAALVSAVVLSSLNMTSARADLPPLIPREVLFGNPERMQPQLSPDGSKMAWVAPDDRNVLQVWVQSLGEDDARPVTADKKRGIRRYTWAENSKVLVYLQDKDGDEDWHIYGVTLGDGSIRDLTPGEKLQARIEATDPKFPDEILIALNERDPSLHDIYRLNINTGELELVAENPGDVIGFQADSNFKVRAAQAATPDGGVVVRVRDDADAPWRDWIKAGPEDSLTLEVLDFTADGKALYLLSAIGRDTAAVIRKDIATGKETVIAASDEVDAGPVLIHPTKHVVQAVAFAPGRRRWDVVDPDVKADFEGIIRLHHGDFSVVNRDAADATWLVAFNDSQGPIRYFAWDRKARSGKFLFVHQPKLEGLELAEMKPIRFSARDGLTIHGYLTLPVGVAPRDLPTVLFVHGGPWARDQWGYHPYAQWLANRGYACLQVNYRGSTGYGKGFINAGNRQWGKAMHDDLVDAKRWAIAQGFADPDRVAVMGGSYGGYAALASVTFTPEEFACAVDIVGPSNLRTLVQSIPPYWKPMRSQFDVRMGNIDDPKDEELLRNASPLFRADKIVRPLLIGQGANDPRVKQAESEQIIEAIEKAGGKVTYILYPDEGHGFARPENSIDFNARAEKFLADHLGGRFEPLPKGDRYPGSTAVVREVGG